MPVLLIMEFFLAIQVASIQRSASRRSYSGIPLLYIPWFICSVIFGLWVFRPLLVVMMITPLAARLPYNAAEAASFKMDMLSISLEFSSAMFPSKGTPSTTNRGLEAPDTNVPKPRTRISGAFPGSPYVLFTCTPGAAPSSAPVTLVVMRFSIFLLSTTEIEPVNDSFLAVP